jgi:hypothetical protein
MTEAAASFAGNLTDQPERRHTDGGIARAVFRVAVAGRREQEASYFHRDRLARPGRARRRVAVEGEPGGGRGLAAAAELDGRGWQRPVNHGGRGRGAGASLQWATTTTTRTRRG